MKFGRTSSFVLLTEYIYLQTVPSCQNLYKNSFTYHYLQEDKKLPFDDAVQYLGESSHISFSPPACVNYQSLFGKLTSKVILIDLPTLLDINSRSVKFRYTLLKFLWLAQKYCSNCLNTMSYHTHENAVSGTSTKCHSIEY